MVPDIEKQIADLEKSISQKKAQLNDLAQKQKAMARKDDTRRKIILGAAVLVGLRDRSAEEKKRTLGWIHQYVTNKRDREFLGLPPLATQDDDKRKSSV